MLRITITCLLSVTAGAQDPGWTHSTLDGGVRLSVLYEPAAPRQSSFVFLPLGLSLDDGHRAQFAHLVEHMLIRQVDPQGMEVDGININGETSAELLRLDAIAPPDKWRDALSHQVRWVTTRSFEDAELEREKGVIAQELHSTVASGYTHKWAKAAWNQVVNHGLAHAAVHDDVMEASIDQVRDYVDRWVKLDDRVHFFAVGPTAPADVAQALAAELTAHLTPEPAAKAKSVEEAAQRVAWPREHIATWDLPLRHYIEYYEIPAESAVDRATAVALANALFLQVVQHADLKRQQVRAQVSADLVGADRRCLALSASLPEGVEVDAVREIFAAVIERALRPRFGRMPERLARQVATQLETVPDFDRQRKLMSGHPRAAWLEANAALQIALHAMRTGVSMTEAPAAYRAVTRKRVTDLLEKALTSERRYELLLTPKPR